MNEADGVHRPDDLGGGLSKRRLSSSVVHSLGRADVLSTDPGPGRCLKVLDCESVDLPLLTEPAQNVDTRTGDIMYGDETAAHRNLWQGLLACPPLSQGSPERDQLWSIVQDVICTRSHAWVTPLGSNRPVLVTSEYAGDELIAAMAWLYAHDDDARRLAPIGLYKSLRGVATKGAQGSGRAAQSDALHGLTSVEAGQLVRWIDIEDWGAA